MRILTAFIAASLISTLSLSAEEKLWTWKPTSDADARSLLAKTMGSDGSGAFVIGETKITSKPPGGPVGNSSYLLLWLNAKGKPIMAKSLKTQDNYTKVHELAQPTFWKVCLMGPGKLVFYDDTTLRIYTLKAGKVTEKKLPISDMTGITLYSAVGFDGWLAHKVAQNGTYPTPDPDGGPDVANPVWDVQSLNAWKP